MRRVFRAKLLVPDVTTALARPRLLGFPRPGVLMVQAPAGAGKTLSLFVFQTFNLIGSLTAWENVTLPAEFARMGSARQRRSRARELLEMVGLGDRAGHRPGELSGGQRQRVAIARALMNKPKLLLADEPTGNLDSATGSAIVGLLKQLNAAGQTLVLVTHNPEVAAQSKSVYRMRDGALRRVVAGEFFAAD